MLFDPEKFGQAMGEAIRKAVEPLHAEIAVLQKALAEKPDYASLVADEVSKAAAAIHPAVDGKDCDMEAVKAMIADAVAALPKAAKGDEGKSITVEDVRPVLDQAMAEIRKESSAAVERILADGRAEREAVKKAMEALRQPEDGKSVTLSDVTPMLEDAIQAMRDAVAKDIAAAIKAIPEPQAGKDGVSLAGAMIDRDGSLMLTLSNGEVKSLGKVVGKDGLDGIGLDSFELDYLGETHEVRVKASCAGRTKELRYPAGGIRPAGYWREGTKAKSGEAWVHDGSTWYAKHDTQAKPETKSDDWIVGARKGRDGETVVKTINAGPAEPIKLKD